MTLAAGMGNPLRVPKPKPWPDSRHGAGARPLAVGGRLVGAKDQREANQSAPAGYRFTLTTHLHPRPRTHI